MVKLNVFLGKNVIPKFHSLIGKGGGRMLHITIHKRILKENFIIKVVENLLSSFFVK